MPLSNWTTAFRFLLGSCSRDGTARKGCGFASNSLKVLLLPVCLITASRTLREIKKLVIKLGRSVISCHIQRKAFGDKQFLEPEPHLFCLTAVWLWESCFLL